jgi:hypothetical protein
MISQNTNTKNNVYLIFIIKLLGLFIFVAFLDFIIGTLLSTFYFKQESGVEYRTTFSLEKTTADVLIFGSSTANHNYLPETFQKRLKMSTYVVGRDGNSILYDFAVLKVILTRYSPKMLLLDFDLQEFTNDKDDYDKLSSLLPYYEKHPEVRSIVDLKSPFEKYKLLSEIYPYNSSIFTIAVGNTEFNKKRRRDLNGYIPLTNVWNEAIKDGSTFLNYALDTNKINIYKSFIENCIDAKIRLYIICSPLFIKPDYTSNSVVIGKKIADKYNIRFINYSKDSSILNNPKLFADISHLNNEGARVYSNKVIDSIMTEYPKRPN